MSDTTKSIPSRRQVAQQPPPSAESTAPETAVGQSFAEEESAFEQAPKKSDLNLAGRYRVREGYTIAHGGLDVNNNHTLVKAGTVIQMTHEEALSVIKSTKDQKDADGRPNGPAIETEVSYNSRIKAQKDHEEFMRALAEANNLP